MRLDIIYKWLMDNDPKPPADKDLQWTALADSVWLHYTIRPTSITAKQMFQLQQRGAEFLLEIPSKYAISVQEVFKASLDSNIDEKNKINLPIKN